MVLILKKGTGRKDILKSLRKLSKQQSKSAFKAEEFHGKLKRGLNGVDYQKGMRDEWS